MNAQFQIKEGTTAFLKALRKERGITQAEMATTIGYNPTGYNQIENGSRFLTLIQVWQIAIEFNITPGDVINGIYGADTSECKSKLLELQDKYNAVVAEKSELQSRIIQLLQPGHGSV